MRSAATKIAGERFLDVRLAWLLVNGQERRSLHNHAVDAIATLNRLLLDKGLLHRMQVPWRA